MKSNLGLDQPDHEGIGLMAVGFTRTRIFIHLQIHNDEDIQIDTMDDDGNRYTAYCLSQNKCNHL